MYMIIILHMHLCLCVCMYVCVFACVCLRLTTWYQISYKVSVPEKNSFSPFQWLSLPIAFHLEEWPYEISAIYTQMSAGMWLLYGSCLFKHTIEISWVCSIPVCLEDTTLKLIYWYSGSYKLSSPSSSKFPSLRCSKDHIEDVHMN